jgi:hypothetical protein
MVICGDLIELIADNNDPDIKIEKIDNVENVPWQFNGDEPIPLEIFSLYSVDSGTITINDVKNDVFEEIKKSEISHVSPRIHVYEEMFILFFEFAKEKYPKDFELIHFGISPTSDFFTTLNNNPAINIRSKKFLFSKQAITRITDHLAEFKNKYPDSPFL